MSKKKNKSQTAAKVKQHTVNILKSLYSNQVCIDNARHYPWWVALIFFVLSICLPVIPVITSNYNTTGSDFMSGQTKGFETYLTGFTYEMSLKDVDLYVNDNHQLIDKDDSWKNTYTYSEDRQYVYTNQNSKQIDFLVYYTHETGDDFTKLNNDIASRQYRIGTDQLYTIGQDTSSSSSQEDDSPTVYTPTYMLFNQTTYIVQIYNPNSTTVFTNTSGDYVNVESGTSLAGFAPVIVLPEVEGVTVPSINDVMANEGYVEEVKNNFINFFNQGYITNRNNATLYSTLLTLGIYLVLAFFMGLMIFLLTRGKKNIMHILSFYVCQKINAWVMFTPAILGMIVGFIFPQFAMIGFILLLGLRVMWMSFRQLRPVIR